MIKDNISCLKRLWDLNGGKCILKTPVFLISITVSAALFLFSGSSVSSGSLLHTGADRVGAYEDDFITDNEAEKSSFNSDINSRFEPVFPKSFDLRKLGLVSETRTQGSYNTCWAICAVESLETQILKNEYEKSPLLSPWHLTFFTYNGENPFFSPTSDVFKAGGTNTLASAVLSRWIGPVSESKAPYNQSKSLPENMKNECEYKVTDILNLHPWISEHKKYSTEFIKELIYDKNSVSCFINSSKNYFTSDTCSFFCFSPSKVTHAVLLVGWDDNFPKENFKGNTQPQNNGAWLVKNSWGEDWGDNGYCWLSYEDKSLCEAACYFCKPSDAYESMLSYDEFGWIASISPDEAQDNTSGYMGSIYTADSPVILSAASFYTTEENADYEISIFKNINDINDPVSGTPVLNISGNEKYTGYHTVNFPADLYIEKNTSFSVVIKLKNPEYPYMIASEASSALISQNNTQSKIFFYDQSKNKPRQSFVSCDGKVWHDTCNVLYTYKYPEKLDLAEEISGLKSVKSGDVCLKVLTSSFLRGDTDSNNIIEPSDLKELLDIFFHDLKEEKKQYDVNQDNSINILDIIRLKSILNNEYI